MVLVTHRGLGSWETMSSVSEMRADSMLSWTHLLLCRPNSKRLVSCKKIGKKIYIYCDLQLFCKMACLKHWVHS